MILGFLLNDNKFYHVRQLAAVLSDEPIYYPAWTPTSEDLVNTVCQPAPSVHWRPIPREIYGWEPKRD